jgi:hypothetical protein
MQFFQSFVQTIRKLAQDWAATTDKFTAQQILKMSGILLPAEFKSARMKSSKVSAWNLFQSDMKATVPDEIRCPTKLDGLRPQFSRGYTKVVAEQWPDYRDEYTEKANNINKVGDKITKVPIAQHQKRMVKKLSELVCHGGAHPHRV